MHKLVNKSIYTQSFVELSTVIKRGNKIYRTGYCATAEYINTVLKDFCGMDLNINLIKKIHLAHPSPYSLALCTSGQWIGLTLLTSVYTVDTNVWPMLDNWTLPLTSRALHWYFQGAFPEIISELRV